MLPNLGKKLAAQQAQAIEASFAKQSFMATLGARLVETGWGRIAIEFAHRSDLEQQHGHLHAGVATAILDSACGYAALAASDAADRMEVLTIEFKASFLNPARPGDFLAVGEVIRNGGRTSFCEGTVFAMPEQMPIVRMSATMALRRL